MLSALGSNFGIDFTAKWATLGPQLGRYIRSKVAQ
jgi:hypothetical protein